MSSVASPARPVRHGSCRIYICINENTYTCSPIRRRPARGVSVALALRKHGGDDGAEVVYGITRTKDEGNRCTCPDHQRRGAHCKHLRALEAAGILPSSRPRERGGAR